MCPQNWQYLAEASSTVSTNHSFLHSWCDIGSHNFLIPHTLGQGRILNLVAQWFRCWIFFNYFICCEMIVFILIILVGIILSFSLLLAIFLCCNSYSCHNRHQNPLTREDWFSSRRRLIFSFQDFYLETREESFNVQMMEHQPIFEGENQPGSSVAQLSNFERSPNPLLLNPSSGKVKFSKDRLSVSQEYWK